MMQTAEPRHGDDFAGPLTFCCLTTTRSLLAQTQLRPVVVVIPDELVHEPFQMPFIHNDYMVEQIPAAGANPAFCDTILSWYFLTNYSGAESDLQDHFSISSYSCTTTPSPALQIVSMSWPAINCLQLPSIEITPSPFHPNFLDFRSQRLVPSLEVRLSDA